jgi:hypothetical protein
MYSEGSPITYTSSEFIFSFVTFHVTVVRAREQSRFDSYYRRIRIETEENNETPALYLGQVSVFVLHPTQCSQFWNQIQSTYNRSKTRYRSESTDFISVTCLQQNRLKVHKTEMTRHTSLALTSRIIFLSGSNPIKCSYQAQDLSSRDV